jgi:hypothetical protein
MVFILKIGGDSKLLKKIKTIVLNPKCLIAVIWGFAIGCLTISIDQIIGYFHWKSGHAIVIFSPSPLIGLLIIGLFSFFYLRSLILGALCGVACEVSLFFQSLFLFPLWINISGVIISSLIFALPGVIGGYLAERKEFARTL